MSMICIHKKALEQKASSYHEFLLCYRKNSYNVYGFVEGKEDPSFYKGFIETLIPENWEVALWPAGNKKQVLKLFDSIDWDKFSKSRVCFFIDRDLSDFIPIDGYESSNIYITDGYSVENSIINQGTFHRVLTELLGLSEMPANDLERVKENFEIQLEKFLFSMSSIMSWMLFCKQQNMQLNLKNINLGKVYSVENEELIIKNPPDGYESIYTFLCDKSQIDFVEDFIERIDKETFEDPEVYKKMVRGKFVLWFFIEYCNSVHRDIVKICDYYNKSPKVHINLSVANGMSIIASRARIPTTLRKFIKSNYLDYINSVITH